MSTTYLVEIARFEDLREGDQIIYHGRPVTIATIGKVPVVGVTAAYYRDAEGVVGTFMAGFEPPMCRIVSRDVAALEAA